MNTGSLNRQDVAALANHATVETKSTIARKVSACYDTGQISQKAAKLAEDIFRIMVRDTEIKVREVLSDSLKHCKDLPKDVVNSILNDKDSIAVPFLQYYASLTKEDLVRILNISNLPRQKAVAKRHGLPAEISDYITDRCETEVVGELLSNNTADIYEKTYLKITDKYASNEDIKKRLVYRSVLPTSVIEKIVDKLSYKLKTYLMLHHNLSDDLASNLVEDVKEKMTLSISEEYSSDTISFLISYFILPPSSSLPTPMVSRSELYITTDKLFTGLTQIFAVITPEPPKLDFPRTFSSSPTVSTKS